MLVPPSIPPTAPLLLAPAYPPSAPLLLPKLPEPVPVRYAVNARVFVRFLGSWSPARVIDYDAHHGLYTVYLTLTGREMRVGPVQLRIATSKPPISVQYALDLTTSSARATATELARRVRYEEGTSWNTATHNGTPMPAATVALVQQGAGEGSTCSQTWKIWARPGARACSMALLSSRTASFLHTVCASCASSPSPHASPPQLGIEWLAAGKLDAD